MWACAHIGVVVRSLLKANRGSLDSQFVQKDTFPVPSVEMMSQFESIRSDIPNHPIADKKSENDGRAALILVQTK